MVSKSLRVGLGQPCGEYRTAGAGQTTQAQRVIAGRQTFGEVSHRWCAGECIENRLQGHTLRLHALASPTSASPATRANQRSGPLRSPREAEENASPAASSSATIRAPFPEPTCLRVGRPRQVRLPGIGIDAHGANRVAPSEQIENSGLRRLKHSSTFDPPLAVFLPYHGDLVRQRHWISRRAVVQRYLTPSQTIEEDVHEGHEAGRRR